MRVWDIAAGYLNRDSLLGEHRELHGVHVVITQGKFGYSRHPETLRWRKALSGLAQRHALLVAEMTLRGYADRTPLSARSRRISWPPTFVTEPADQLALLRVKYRQKSPGRIPLPRNVQELWAQHKYSVMARDVAEYQRLGRGVARLRSPDAAREVARELVVILREAPSAGGMTNALEHMWGYVREVADAEERRAIRREPRQLLATVQALARRSNQPYLLASTALSELAIYV